MIDTQRLMGDDERDDREPEYRQPEYDPRDYEPPDPGLEEEGPEIGFIHWPRDPHLDQAKADLMEWFEAKQVGVFYGRQIEVIFEKKYFHWITHKALKELTNGGLVATDLRITAFSH